MKTTMLWAVLLAGCAGGTDVGEDPLEPVPVVKDMEKDAFADAGLKEKEPVADAGRSNHFRAVSQITCGQYCHVGIPHFAGKKSEAAPTRDLVVPGDPDRSYLMLKLLGSHVNLPECAGTPSPCGKKMPASGELRPGELEAIRAWIAEGAPMSEDE